MGAIISVLVFMAISAIFGAVTNWLRGLQQRDQERAKQEVSERAVQRSESRASVSEVDRFLEEIERLRNKETAKPPVARRVQTPEPLRAPEPAPVRTRVETAQPASFDVKSLPEAIAPPPPPSAPAAPATVQRATQRPRPVAKADFGKRLGGMITDRKMLPMMIVLSEILGPPKCQRNQEKDGNI